MRRQIGSAVVFGSGSAGLGNACYSSNLVSVSSKAQQLSVGHAWYTELVLRAAECC